MINKGQARRIAAEYQAPGNGYSALQHVGLITEELADEIALDMRHEDSPAWHDLAALLEFAQAHGPGKVANWGEWDDTPVS
jgi:predicted AlkP superfamily pyrophosphatase or phosphodiesterase